MYLRNEQGLTLVVLIITIIIMLILVVITMKFGHKELDKVKIIDIMTNMLSIKPKAKIMIEQYNFGDIETLVGEPLDTDPATEGIQTGTYTIPNELKSIFEAQENGTPKMDISKLYVWTKQDLDNAGLSTIKTDENKFYIVYYNMDNPNDCEIYYSLGYNTKDGIKYSLAETTTE